MSAIQEEGANGVSVNARAAVLVSELRARADELRVGVVKGELGETLIDAGARHIGGVAAGLLVAEICLGGLGDVSLFSNAETPRWPWSVAVRSSNPVIACLASQYAGWRLSHGEGRDAFFALGSGPARSLSRKEALFRELDYCDAASSGTLIIESDRSPPRAVVAKVAEECGLEPSQLTFIYAPTQSLAGGCQIVARVLEVALHKLHELKFPLERVIDGMGAAPLPPPHPDFVTAMGRTNDAIIYAGKVHIFVTGPAADAKALAEQLPSVTSRDYGWPFAEIFRRFKGDFYAIDPMLFSPAEVIVTAVQTGETFHSGRADTALLDASFNA
jgi:methenyltetrahydromethanopterin cyclohydrolase